MPSERKLALLYTQQRYKQYQHDLASLQKEAGSVFHEDPFKLPVKAVGIISQEHQRLLAIAAKAKDEYMSPKATELLIITNYLQIKKIAMKYLGKGLEEKDLIQHGKIGLVRSLDKYDPKNQKSTFLTYATWWIKQAIGRAVQEHGSLIRLPAGKHDVRIKVEKCLREINVEHYTADYIVEQIYRSDMASYNPNSEKSPPKKLKVGHVQEILDHLATAAHAPVSLDQNMQNDDGDGMSISERIACEVSTEEAVRRAEHTRLRSKIRDIIDETLQDPFQKTVICRRYGLEGSTSYTAREISEQLGEDSPNRVNKAIQSALKQLKPALVAAGITEELVN